MTRYGLEWLARNSYEGQKQQVMHPRILWNAEIYQQAQVPSIDCRSFLETDEGLKEFLQNFLLYGIAFVENVTPTKEDTEILAKRISIIRYLGYPEKGKLIFFLFGKLLPPCPVFCVAWPAVQKNCSGCSPGPGMEDPTVGSTLLYGRAVNHSVTELPPEHPMTSVTVGLCREEGLKEVAGWEEQGFARRDISCYDLGGHEGSLALGAREIKDQLELLLEKNSERCWCWVCVKHHQHGRPGAELGALSKL